MKILFEKSFDQITTIASADSAPFCIVLVDSSKTMAATYHDNLLNTYTGLSRKAFFNIVDISVPDNKWLEQWLSPVYVPLTCVFTSSGRLVDLIPGMSYESFSYMEESIEKRCISSNMPCRNRFGMDKGDYVNFMDAVLQARIKVNNGLDARMEIDSTLAVFEYPFNLGLKQENQLWLSDSLGAKETAERMMAINSPYNLINFPEQYEKAKKTLDPGYDSTTEPYMELCPKTISLGECYFNEERRFEIAIKNTGSKELHISDVATSCSCLKYQGACEFSVIPGDSVSVSFLFIAETIGNIERGAYFMSNALNPVADFTVYANVKK